MSEPRAWIAGVIAVLVVSPSAARAQSLAQLLPRLLSEAVTMSSTVGLVGAGNPHEAHFLPAAAQLRAPYALNSALVSQLSTFPLGSSSGGFTYTFDESTGIPQRSSGNFGPAFAERALTIGKGKLSAGINYQHVEFDKFDGLGLGGDVQFYLQHNDCCPVQNDDGTPNPNAVIGPSQDVNPFFEGDLVRARLDLKAKTDTTVFFLNYGISKRIDIAAAVPFVHVDLNASITSTIIRIATASNPLIHTFGGSSPDVKVSRETGSSTGIGDVLLRLKYRFVAQPGGGLALGLDARLPTGNENELHGTGATQLKGLLIYSRDYGRFAPHLNAGYTFSSGSLSNSVGTYALGDEVPQPITTAPNAYQTVFRGQTPGSPLSKQDLEVPDEVDFTAGFAIQASPRITLNADMVGRTLLQVNRFSTTPQVYSYRLLTGGSILQTGFNDGVDITQEGGNLTLLLGTAGLKINITKTLLLNASVLFPLNGQGLQPKTTFAAGLDYAF